MADSTTTTLLHVPSHILGPYLSAEARPACAAACKHLFRAAMAGCKVRWSWPPAAARDRPPQPSLGLLAETLEAQPRATVRLLGTDGDVEAAAASRLLLGSGGDDAPWTDKLADLVLEGLALPEGIPRLPLLRSLAVTDLRGPPAAAAALPDLLPALTELRVSLATAAGRSLLAAVAASPAAARRVERLRVEGLGALSRREDPRPLLAAFVGLRELALDGEGVLGAWLLPLQRLRVLDAPGHILDMPVGRLSQLATLRVHALTPDHAAAAAACLPAGLQELEAQLVWCSALEAAPQCAWTVRGTLYMDRTVARPVRALRLLPECRLCIYVLDDDRLAGNAWMLRDNRPAALSFTDLTSECRWRGSPAQPEHAQVLLAAPGCCSRVRSVAGPARAAAGFWAAVRSALPTGCDLRPNRRAGPDAFLVVPASASTAS